MMQGDPVMAARRSTSWRRMGSVGQNASRAATDAGHKADLGISLMPQDTVYIDLYSRITLWLEPCFVATRSRKEPGKNLERSTLASRRCANEDGGRVEERPSGVHPVGSTHNVEERKKPA